MTDFTIGRGRNEMTNELLFPFPFHFKVFLILDSTKIVICMYVIVIANVMPQVTSLAQFIILLFFLN